MESQNNNNNSKPQSDLVNPPSGLHNSAPFGKAECKDLPKNSSLPLNNVFDYDDDDGMCELPYLIALSKKDPGDSECRISVKCPDPGRLEDGEMLSESAFADDGHDLLINKYLKSLGENMSPGTMSYLHEVLTGLLNFITNPSTNANSNANKNTSLDAHEATSMLIENVSPKLEKPDHALHEKADHIMDNHTNLDANVNNKFNAYGDPNVWNGNMPVNSETPSSNSHQKAGNSISQNTFSTIKEDSPEDNAEADLIQSTNKKVVANVKKTPKRDRLSKSTPHHTPQDENKKSSKTSETDSLSCFRCKATWSKEQYDTFRLCDAVFTKLKHKLQYGYTEDGMIITAIEWNARINLASIEAEVKKEAYDKTVNIDGKLEASQWNFDDVLKLCPIIEEDYGVSAEGLKKKFYSEAVLKSEKKKSKHVEESHSKSKKRDGGNLDEELKKLKKTN